MKKHYMFFFILLLTLVTGRVYYAHSAITPIDETGYSTSNQTTPTPRAAAAGNTGFGQDPDAPIVPTDPYWCYETHNAGQGDYVDHRCGYSDPYCDWESFPIQVNYYMAGSSKPGDNYINMQEEDSQALANYPFNLYACCYTNGNDGDIYFGCSSDASANGLPLLLTYNSTYKNFINPPTCTNGTDDCYITTYYNLYNIKAPQYNCDPSVYTESIPSHQTSGRECCYYDLDDQDYYCKPIQTSICNFTDQNFIARIKDENITTCSLDQNTPQLLKKCTLDEAEVSYCQFTDSDPYTFCNIEDGYSNKDEPIPMKSYIDLQYNSEKANNSDKLGYIPCITMCKEDAADSCVGYRYAAYVDYCSSIRHAIESPTSSDPGYIPVLTTELSPDSIFCLDKNGEFTFYPYQDTVDDTEEEYNSQYERKCIGYYSAQGCDFRNATYDEKDICSELTEEQYSEIKEFHKCVCPSDFVSYNDAINIYGASIEKLKDLQKTRYPCMAECSEVDIANDYIECLKFDPEDIHVMYKMGN